ncbi:hypothetical protein, partial [uncultured Desulfovibrio sp.]|uniref:hypothetical protein n=1 Tax=uncultured Desulfovibrio sp. TaxID=167968 RepID=UPI003207CA3D
MTSLPNWMAYCAPLRRHCPEDSLFNQTVSIAVHSTGKEGKGKCSFSFFIAPADGGFARHAGVVACAAGDRMAARRAVTVRRRRSLTGIDSRDAAGD